MAADNVKPLGDFLESVKSVDTNQTLRLRPRQRVEEKDSTELKLYIDHACCFQFNIYIYLNLKVN